jgi:succinyl-CoA synthetase alpha subunit
MSILVNKNTIVLVQGITGKEGSRAAREMRSYGTVVAAGVTPGKGGESIDGTPVYNSVAEALQSHPTLNATLIAVPGKFVRAAAEEAIRAHIPLINILSERVPVADVAYVLALARQQGVTVVGPSSVGVISPNEAKMGSIGSGGMAAKVFTPGPIGVISKSGGMTSEISRVLSDAGLGQSTALGIGGDPLVGLDFLDTALLFECDPQTKALVIFGEVGGTYEERLAEGLSNGVVTKPTVALIAGVFAESLPMGTTLGHAGAIIEGERSKASSKIMRLKAAGAHVAETPEDIVDILKSLL